MKMRIVVLLIFVAMVATASIAVAEEMSGIISNVRIYPRETFFGNPAMTVIEFEDGRVITFQGIYLGVVFEKGKKHKITYGSDWTIQEIKYESGETIRRK